ncbi:MAG: ELM1/GtrOC1 family putative glycosyltransferase [Hyphomicrobiales bacterium]
MSAGRSIWVLQGARAGDNAQARELARRIDGIVQFKDLRFNRLHNVPNWALGASLASLTAEASAILVPPWPDLVVATGKRTAPVARWIKKQSGGKAKIVHIGRPRARLSAFDLVITTPQYGLPAAENLVENLLPFATPRQPDWRAIDRWSSGWSHLPRPWIALAVGAPKYPLRLQDADIGRLAKAANDLVMALNGSLIVLGSPRTAAGVVDKIGGQLRAPASLHPWNMADNPYQSALALADRFIVTSDSASMISEAVRTGRPVDIFILPSSKLKLSWRAAAGLGAWLSRQGILQPPRDMSRLVDKIVACGYARPLGSDMTTKPMSGSAGGDIVARIKSLFEDS